MTEVTAPPQDLAAEQSVLGAVLLADRAMLAVTDEGLRPEHFYRRSHSVIFQAMLDLESDGESIDALTLRNKLDTDGLLDAAGGQGEIDLLAGAVPAISSLRTYCRIVREKYRWRRRLEAAYAQIEHVMDEDEEAHARALGDADAADPAADRSDLDPWEDFMEWYASESSGYTTPFTVLTEAIGGGWVPGDVTVIGGWPGHGKTIVADQIMLHCATQGARGHTYFNEMKAAFRTARMLARLTGIPWWRIRDKQLVNDEWEKLYKAKSKLPTRYSTIEGWPVEWICRHIRRHKWDVAVVDTVSRIPHKDTRDLERVSGMLADTAREVNCHLFEVCQLNLERCKQAVRPIPTGRDLLGGGMWYRDARNVVFVHRKQETQHGLDVAIAQPDGIVYTDKATHGEPEKGIVPVTFVPRFMRFDEREETQADVRSIDRARDDAADAPVAAGAVASGGGGSDDEIPF